MPGRRGVPARDRTFGLARRGDFLRDTAVDPSRVAAAPQVKMATAPHENAPQASIGPAAPVSHTGFAAPAWLTPAVRVRAFTALIALVAVGLAVAVVPGLTPLPPPFAIP